MVEHIPVFYASNENYARACVVSMFSILSNTNHHIDFYVLDNRIRRSTKRKMRNALKRFNNHTLTFIPIDEKQLHGMPTYLWFTLTAYFRYYIPELCPNVNKCIYLDVDTIINHDIYDLWNVDLDGHILAAVPAEQGYLQDSNFQKYFQDMGLSNEHVYFGSGIMLFDVDLWRKRQSLSSLLKITRYHHDVIKYADQDALNILCSPNKYKPLDTLWGRDIRTLAKEMSEYKSIETTCKLVHFDGPIKPWHKKCFGDWLFWKYAKQTGLYPRPSLFKLRYLYLKYKFSTLRTRRYKKYNYICNKTKFRAYCE